MKYKLHEQVQLRFLTVPQQPSTNPAHPQIRGLFCGDSQRTVWVRHDGRVCNWNYVGYYDTRSTRKLKEHDCPFKRMRVENLWPLIMDRVIEQLEDWDCTERVGWKIVRESADNETTGSFQNCCNLSRVSVIVDARGVREDWFEYAMKQAGLVQ